MSVPNEILYKDDLASVSRYWLTNEATSYAIRTLVRLTFIERKPPPIRTLLLFLIALTLLFFSGLYLVRETLPAALAWLLILLSLFLLLHVCWIAFLKKPLFLIKAVFIDGQEVKIIRRNPTHARGMYEAINKAMSFHRYYASPFDEYAPSVMSEVEQKEKEAILNLQAKRKRLRNMIAIFSDPE
ncbi:MAG: hypothetical protein KTR32_02670 [Granulosicoccus sp.]|nr:hypothetical protein [Granulosicoccus sp.]